MRVDAISKVSQLYQANSAKKTIKNDVSSRSDQFQMSQTGKDYQIAKQAVSSVPDVREDRVNDIKNRIATGTYNISSKEVADKLAENYFNKTI